MKVLITGGVGTLLSVLEAIPKRTTVGVARTPASDIIVTLSLSISSTVTPGLVAAPGAASVKIKYENDHCEFSTAVPVSLVNPHQTTPAVPVSLVNPHQTTPAVPVSLVNPHQTTPAVPVSLVNPHQTTPASIRIGVSDILNIVGCCDIFSDICIEFVSSGIGSVDDGSSGCDKLIITCDCGNSSKFRAEIRGVLDCGLLGSSGPARPPEIGQNSNGLQLQIDSEILGSAFHQCLDGSDCVLIFIYNGMRLETKGGDFETRVDIPLNLMSYGISGGSTPLVSSGDGIPQMQGRIRRKDVESIVSFLSGFGGSKCEIYVNSLSSAFRWMKIVRKMITNNDGELNILLAVV